MFENFDYDREYDHDCGFSCNCGCSCHRPAEPKVAGNWTFQGVRARKAKELRKSAPEKPKPNLYLGRQPIRGVPARLAKTFGGKWDPEVRVWLIPDRHVERVEAKLKEMLENIPDFGARFDDLYPDFAGDVWGG